MKKRMLAVLLAAGMVCGVAGCGSQMAQEESENPIATEMQAELQSFDAELTAEAAAAEGMYTIKNGAVAGGQENWDAFMEGELESVILCQFTLKDGAMLDYVNRLEDGTYLVVSDLTRDGYEHEEKEDYTIKTFTEMKIFEDFAVSEGSTPHTVCVMTNDADLDADTFLTYWNEQSLEENGAFMLFVI